MFLDDITEEVVMEDFYTSILDVIVESEIEDEDDAEQSLLSGEEFDDDIIEDEVLDIKGVTY